MAASTPPPGAARSGAAFGTSLRCTGATEPGEPVRLATARAGANGRTSGGAAEVRAGVAGSVGAAVTSAASGTGRTASPRAPVSAAASGTGRTAQAEVPVSAVASGTGRTAQAEVPVSAAANRCTGTGRGAARTGAD
ncbi:hypothetical protein [Streptacidiphilus neutrinimicus]|uniref:hypothetical protein n=1 Tax=Streptacidiphilus neutrinimicus TaxID=105420 RepID=UPI00126A3A81|nr:hypothetical protein [Streptacidiphilus neutrinimicus]